MSKLRELYLYCRRLGLPVDPHVAAVAIRAVGNYSSTRSAYVSAITTAMVEYMRGYAGMVASRNTFKKAMVDAFGDSFETGYMETAGGDTFEPERADSQYLAAKMDAELGYIDALFFSLKEVMAGATIEDPVTDADIVAEADNRAAMFARTLDGVYGQGKLRGKKNKMLTFTGPNGSSDNICQKNNGTCVRLMGQRHRAKWWTSHDLVPYPGNENYDCGAYECRHFLQDDDGNRWAGNLQMVQGGPV